MADIAAKLDLDSSDLSDSTFSTLDSLTMADTDISLSIGSDFNFMDVPVPPVSIPAPTSVPDLDAISVPDLVSVPVSASSRSRSVSHSDSSDSSDYIISHQNRPHIMSSVATVKGQNPKIAPILTAGRVTPEVLHQWERACKEHFRIKHVDKDKQVESVLSRIQDFRTADWIEANEAILVALPFSGFMEKL